MAAFFDTLIIILIIAAILLVVFSLLIMPSMRHPKVLRRCLGKQFAHRGLHDSAKGIPENSLAAYKKAVENGFGIELDVRLTSDGVPVIMHDPSAKRMTGVDRRISEMTLSELKPLRISGTDQHIPTLAEALSLVNGQVPIIVELKIEKDNFDQLGTKVFEVLDKYKGDYVMECFDPRMLSWLRKNRPKAVRGQLIMYFKRHGDKALPAIADWLTHNLILNVIARPDFISIYYPDRRSLPLKLCRLIGVKEFDWTVTSQKQLDICREDGVESTIFEGFIPDSKK